MINKMGATSRERQRLYLERQKNGLVVLHVLCDHVGIVEMLLAEGFLETHEPNRQQLGEALSKWTFKEMTRHAERHWPVR